MADHKVGSSAAESQSECADHMTIPLTKGKVAIVSAEDYDQLSQYSWHASRTKNKHYAKRAVWMAGGKKRTIYMHREIMRASEEHVDHINGDSLDNRRGNLRAAKHYQNLRNQRLQEGRSSRFKGVYWSSKDYSWTVQIKDRGRTRVITGIAGEEVAARIYDLLALDRFGEFARYNFPNALFGLVEGRDD